MPVARLLGHSGFGDSFGRVEDSISKDTQEIISLGIGLMWNDTTVCGVIMGLEFLVRDSSEM